MTTIQWTDETWNPTTGCSRVSEGCRHCYIERTPPFRMAGRKLGDPVQLHPDRLDAPLHWRKPRRVFVNSLSDLFHEDVPNEFIVAVFGVMAVRPDHIFQILTKRPRRMLDWFQWVNSHGGFGRYIRGIRVSGDRTIPNFFNRVAKTEMVHGKTVRAVGDPWMSVFNAASFHMTDGRLGNVWLGVSVEDQQTADKRIPILLQVPAAVRFLSVEPLLGPVMLSNYGSGSSISWVIVGGESGPKSRPCDLAWIRSIVEQCKTAKVPCFVKQLGGNPYHRVGDDLGMDGMYRLALRDKRGGNPEEWPADLRVREWPR